MCWQNFKQQSQFFKAIISGKKSVYGGGDEGRSFFNAYHIVCYFSDLFIRFLFCSFCSKSISNWGLPWVNTYKCQQALPMVIILSFR